MSPSNLSTLIGNALLAWFPFLVLFVMLPTGIWQSNRIDFGSDLGILAPFLIAASGSLAACFALAYLNAGRVSGIVTILFLVGVFLSLSDILVPPKWGLMDGSEQLLMSRTSVLIQVGLVLALIGAWWRLPRASISAFGVPIMLVSLAWQVVLLGQTLLPPAVAHVAEGHSTTASASKNLPNVYQIVFDGYTSLLFEEAAAQTQLDQSLDGFTFFKSNLSNFDITDASVPSFMTGRIFKGGSFKEFQLAAKSGGLRRDLQDAGYTISIYAPDQSRFWMYDGATHVHTSEIIGKTDWRRLAEIVMVRASPELLREPALRLIAWGSGGSTRGYQHYKKLSVPLMQQFLDDEATRPATGEYVYVHLILPHGPFVWGASDCQASSKSSYADQTICATTLMKRFVEELKQLGRYDSSMIILQSDHGWHGLKDRQPAFTLPGANVREKVRSRQGYDVDGFFVRLNALLLVKPPAASGPLKVSKDTTQLADIPATVQRTLSLPPSQTDGHSVFALDEVPDREISVLTGVFSNDAKGNRKMLGQHTNNASIAHLGYHPLRGWAVYPDIAAVHPGW